MGTYTTYACEPFPLERGAHVERYGVMGEGRLLAWRTDESPERNLTVIVVAWKGRGENPGSRYSGIYSYYPAETEVYVYDHTTPKGTRRYRILVGWETRAKKES